MNGENGCSEETGPDTSRTGGALRAGRGEPEPESVTCGPANAMIRPVENGFIAEVGCKTFVSQDWEELAAALGEYWKNPMKAEKKFSKNVNSLPVGYIYKCLHNTQLSVEKDS